MRIKWPSGLQCRAVYAHTGQVLARDGDRLWIVDLIDLTGTSQQNMIAELKATVFKGQTFKYHRMEPDGRRVTVTERAV